MERLWAPWRKIYLKAARRKNKGPASRCIFCERLKAPARKDAQNLLLHRSSHSFVILNRFPYINGHLLVLPNRHVSSIENLDDTERLDALRLIDLSMALLRRAMKPEGFNVGLNLGLIGGAGVRGHVHWHVVPRWQGDTNFMPVLAGTRVISDLLSGTYKELRRYLK